jgi:hypothetical protein
MTAPETKPTYIVDDPDEIHVGRWAAPRVAVSMGCEGALLSPECARLLYSELGQAASMWQLPSETPDGASITTPPITSRQGVVLTVAELEAREDLIQTLRQDLARWLTTGKAPEITSLPNTLSIGSYMHCARCLEERPPDESPKSYARLAVGMTPEGMQVWCVRHDCNVMHVHFQGMKHPANMTRQQTAEEVAELSARMTTVDLGKAAEAGEPVLEVSLGVAHTLRVLVATGSWTSVLGRGSPRSIHVKNLSSKARIRVRTTDEHVLPPGGYLQLEGYEGALDATVEVAQP